MIMIQGTCNTAVCYCKTLEAAAREQIERVCSQKAFADSKIRIMPDVHMGKGCTIGTTMTIKDKVVPGMVGVDIGCGMETVKLAQRQIDFQQLDTVIRKNIPCGRNVREHAHPFSAQIDLSQLRCAAHTDLDRAAHSIGTLGGGNHFIELDKNADGVLYLVVHSGSRHIGNEVAQYYQQEGLRVLSGTASFQIDQLIEQLKTEGRQQEIAAAIHACKQRKAQVNPDLAYVEGDLFWDYVHDMKLIQQFAAWNRRAIVAEILSVMQLTAEEQFTTIHNYIDTEKMILRKGAVSAQKGEKLLIPINMRDGSLICLGKGNEAWNYSAPHGAGRLLSRKQAKKQLSMEMYKTEMTGIFTTCVMPDTLDEAPMAYKDMDEIVSQMEPTVQIIEQIRPVYNFKATE